MAEAAAVDRELDRSSAFSLSTLNCVERATAFVGSKSFETSEVQFSSIDSTSVWSLTR
jgi:hypothetical protein